jgi:pimeloyl-ACP methyl ester carboxylesterase
MSAIIVEGDLVHYEVLGRGKPIVLIHGWLGSWRYWLPTMQQMGIKYRCYALDLWGFGDSGKDPSRYTFEAQANLLNEFMDRMGFPKVVLVGHGLGAALAAHFAAAPQTADKIHRLLLVAPPLLYDAPSLAKGITALTANSGLTLAANQPMPDPLTDSQANMPVLSRSVLREAAASVAQEKTMTIVGNSIKEIFESQPLEGLLARATSPEVPGYDKLKAQVAKTDNKAVIASTNAFGQISTFHDVMQSRCSTLVMLGENDSLLPRPEEALLQQLNEREALKLLVLGSRHFPMLEDTTQFIRVLKDFVEAPDVTKLEMKEEWVRRKR